jgi:hypothetical protein
MLLLFVPSFARAGNNKHFNSFLRFRIFNKFNIYRRTKRRQGGTKINSV